MSFNTHSPKTWLPSPPSPFRRNALKVNLCWWFCVRRRPIATTTEVHGSEAPEFRGQSHGRGGLLLAAHADWNWQPKLVGYIYIYIAIDRYIYIDKGIHGQCSFGARARSLDSLPTQKGGTKLLWNAVRTIIARTPYCHTADIWLDRVDRPAFCQFIEL